MEDDSAAAAPTVKAKQSDVVTYTYYFDASNIQARRWKIGGNGKKRAGATEDFINLDAERKNAVVAKWADGHTTNITGLTVGAHLDMMKKAKLRQQIKKSLFGKAKL